MGTTRLAPIPAPIVQTETDWKIGGFDSFIDRRGYRLDLYRAHRCGCRRDRTRQPDYVCPLCLDRGDTLELLNEIRGLFHAANQRTGLETSGIWELGEAQVTVKRDVQIDEGDALVFKKYTNRKSEIIRTSGKADKLRFNFVEEIQRVSYIAAEDVARVRDLDEKIRLEEATAAEKAERNALINELEILLENGVDYNLLIAGNRAFIKFIDTPRKPPPDAAVSVLYLHNPEFVVIDLPNDDLDRDVKITQHRKVRRRDLEKGEDSVTPSASPEVPS